VTLRIQRVVNDELLFKNFKVAQAQRAKTEGYPAQTFSGWMRFGRVRIRSAHDFTE